MGGRGVLTQSSRAQLRTGCHCNTKMAGMEGPQTNSHCPQTNSRPLPSKVGTQLSWSTYPEPSRLSDTSEVEEEYLIDLQWGFCSSSIFDF